MKRISILIAAAALFAGTAVTAQETTSPKFKPYGFIRNYAFVDTRATKSLAEDIFFFIPLDEKIVNGQDVNAVSSFNFQAISTRLGLDISGYQVGNTKIGGKIEADFYCLNSGGNTGTLRMRQAYVDLIWEGSSLRIGQAWHPLAADLVHGINLETGAPFTPFNRSAQIMYNLTFSKNAALQTGFIQQLQYRSAGPDGSSNKYQRHAFPEFYVGMNFNAGPFLWRVGADVLGIRPRYGYSAEGRKYDELLTTLNLFTFFQYTKGMVQVKAKSVLAQAGEHMQLNGGYAVTGLKSDGFSREYAPINSSVSFVSVSVGKKIQGLGMIGYQKNLGMSRAYDHNVGGVYFSGNGYSNINQMVRFTPTVMYNLGKMQFALEYDMTMVQYAKELNEYLLPTGGLHWVANNRLLLMAKFNF